MRAERCACGGVIVARSLAVAGPAVRAHQATPRHQLWRRWFIDYPGYDAELAWEKLPSVHHATWHTGG